MADAELKLPDEVLENIPSATPEMVKYLARYFESVIDKYDERFQRRMQGNLGGPLSRYERSILKDFLIDLTLGKIEADRSAPESLPNI